MKNSTQFSFVEHPLKCMIHQDVMPYGVSKIDLEIEAADRSAGNTAPYNVVWFHLNFADAHLFGFYGGITILFKPRSCLFHVVLINCACGLGSLLAQDELQVLEIPFLAFAREALLTRKDELRFEASTKNGYGATPVIVENAPHLGTLDLRGGALYGNKFRSASSNIVNGNDSFFLCEFVFCVL
jgi:hypothetical protein